jgi:hypothetical protein
MKALSYRLINLWRQYMLEASNWLSARETYGRSSPASVTRASIVKDTLHAYFQELEKHVDQEPDIFKPRPKEGA